MSKGRLGTDKQFLAWAKQHTQQLDASDQMVGVFSDGGEESFEFQLQIGHCLCTGKPIAIVAVEGTLIPAKLQLLADATAFFRVDDDESMQTAILDVTRAIASKRSREVM